ncbi:hypothetical protein [Halobacillus halophilus]|uniref:hypothetical protein n=1 Tax=Halobacillus halophilus TaxID=1570 RepID=UPI001CD22874|nr:hypothetical protein [Halobacillus halophilus]MCA1011622.1 hypothetical protein [Halobacillus halophilus]
MSFLSWFDWINPTNPYASLFMGILFSIFLGITVWVETKEQRKATVTAIIGIVVTCIGVGILTAVGYYG